VSWLMVAIGKFTVLLSLDFETVDLAEIRIHSYDSLGNSYSSRQAPVRLGRPRSVPLMTHLASLSLTMVTLPVERVNCSGGPLHPNCYWKSAMFDME
jgi:hypothetical protein